MKKIFVFLSLMFVTLVATACSDKVEIEEFTGPRFSNVNIYEEKYREKSGIDYVNSIYINIQPLNRNAAIYVMVVPAGSKAPTNEQIEAGVDYSKVDVLYSSNKEDNSVTFFDQITEFDNGVKITDETEYDVYATLKLWNDDLGVDEYSSKYYSTTVRTYSTEGLLDRGMGTQNDPYKIFTLADLVTVNENTIERPNGTSAYFELQNDIDLSKSFGDGLGSFTPLGKETGSRQKFAGVFDGNGYTINGLYIDTDSEGAGLFGELDVEGTIKNVTLTNIDITSSSQRTGAIVGYAKGLVEDCQVIGGTISSVGTTTAKVGGAIGEFYNSGSALRIYTDVTVVSEGNYAGGILGSIQIAPGDPVESTVQDCYATGKIIATGSGIGGVVGYIKGKVLFDRCYATGNISGEDKVGGLIGEVTWTTNSTDVAEDIKIQNSFVIGMSITANTTSTSNTSGAAIGSSSNTNGVFARCTVTNVSYADTNVYSLKELSSDSIVESTKSAIIDSSNLTSLGYSLRYNLTDFGRPVLNFTGSSISKCADDGDYIVPIKFDSKSVDVTGYTSIQTSLKTSEANTKIYYMVTLATSEVLSNDEIMSGFTDKNIGQIYKKGNIANGQTGEMVSVTGLAQDTTYDVHIVVEDTTDSTRTESYKLSTTTTKPLTANVSAVNTGVAGEVSVSVVANENCKNTYVAIKGAYDSSIDKAYVSVNGKEASSSNFLITSLEDETQYTIYVLSTYGDDEAVLNHVTLTTIVNTTPVELNALAAAGTSAGSIMLSTTSESLSQVYYIVDSSSTLNPTVSQMKNGTLVTNANTLITDLVAGNTYTVYVQSFVGSRQSEVVKITTQASETNEALVISNPELTLGTPSYSSIIAGIEVSSEIASVYALPVLTSSSYVPTSEDMIKKGDVAVSNSINVNGLYSNTSYVVYFMAVLGEDQSSIVKSASITTGEYNAFNGSVATSTLNVYNAEDFENLAKAYNNEITLDFTPGSKGTIILQNNIRFNGETSGANMTMFTNTSGFEVSFNGNGYTIYDMKLNGDAAFFGLFSYAKSGTYSDVTFVNADVTNTASSNSSGGVGILLGRSHGTVTGVTVIDSTVQTTVSTDSRIGAVAGKMTGGQIQNIIISGVTISGTKNVGGVVGYAEYSSSTDVVSYVSNVYVEDVTIIGTQYTGGVVGQSLMSVRDVVVVSVTCTNTSNNGVVIGQMKNNSKGPSATLSGVLIYTNVNEVTSTPNGNITEPSAVITNCYKVDNSSTPTYSTDITIDEITLEFVRDTVKLDMSVWTLKDGIVMMEVSK